MSLIDDYIATNGALDNNYNYIEVTVPANTTITLASIRRGDTTTLGNNDWGDGTVDSKLSHIYVAEGTYIIKSKLSINAEAATSYNWQQYITNYYMINKNMTSLICLCYRFSNITSIDASIWDTSNVTNMSYMFGSCSKLTTLDVSKFNTSNVTNMSAMFKGCSNLTTLDVSKFNTSKVTNMNDMFYNCSNLTTLDVSKFNTSNVTNMSNMFCGCSKLTTLDTSNFNTSNVTNMNYMFGGCNNLTTLDTSNFNTSNVTNMSNMFRNCNNLASIDVSNFNTSKVANMNYMFGSCSNLTMLNVSKFNTNNVTNMGSMFRSCSNLVTLDISNFNTSNVTNMSMMFKDCSNLHDIALLHCELKTINAISSVIGNTIARNIYLLDTKSNDCILINNINFIDVKTYTKDLYLNSPLLKGDKIVAREDGLYHYHGGKKVIYDGSVDENIGFYAPTSAIMFSGVLFNRDYCSNAILTEATWEGINIFALKVSANLGITTVTQAREYLQANPITIVCKNHEPYYEKISDDKLILETPNNATLSIVSLIPVQLTKVEYASKLSSFDNVVDNQPVNNVINLTIDKVQTTTINANTTINLPTQLNYREIHLFFEATANVTITVPSCRWSTVPSIVKGNCYEFIFTHVDETIGWVAESKTYTEV